MPALIVSYTSHPGGSERILADHAQCFGRDAVAACPEGWLADRLRKQGLRVFPLRARGLELRGARAAAAAGLVGHAREVRGLVEALRPSTVVAWGMRSGLACAGAWPRLRVEQPRLVFQHVDLLPGGAAGLAVRRAAAAADVVLALSDAIARDLDPSGRLGVVVIRPGVDLARFTPPAAAVSPDAPALWLGALVEWKRPELAVEAARLAGIDLVLAGAPLDEAGRRLEARLRAAAADPSVTLAGRLDDPTTALQRASLLLHTADREPYGMVLVEALACGVPVVAPAAGGPREIAGEDCARLFRPGDAHAAAAAIKAARDARPELAAAARARAEQHFDLEHSRGRYRELLQTHEPVEPADEQGRGIALVTVLHNSADDLKALLTSLDRHLPHAHLIAVDSGSTDGGTGAQAARDWRGNATVVELAENVGFGAATNEGVKHAQEPVTVVLNPDVELLDGSLAELAEEAAHRPERILAPLVVLPDGSRQDNVHAEPATRAELLRAAVPPPAGGTTAYPSQANTPARVGWAVACCIAAKTDTLQRLGPFDPGIFLYGEDLDLGLRASDSGVETWFWPHARVLHKRAHSTAQVFTTEPYRLLAQRRQEAIEKNRGAKARRADDLIQAATFANRIVLRTLLKRPTGRERRQLRAIRPGRSSR